MARRWATPSAKLEHKSKMAESIRKIIVDSRYFISIHAQNKRQLMDERAAVNTRMNHLHEPPKQAFVRMRLAAVEHQLGKHEE